MNWRGEYEGGGMIVTAKHWWSPRDRKAAKLAARVLEYERPRIPLSMWPDRPIFMGRKGA